MVLHQESTQQVTVIHSSKTFRFKRNKQVKAGVNNNKIIFHLQRLNIKSRSKILKYSSRIYLRVQADHNKKQEDSFLTLIKVLIGIIKI